MAQTLRKRLKIKVLSKKSVSAIFERPAKARALLVLAHGAGAGMEHAFLRDLVKSLHEEGVATLRFQFPYMEEGSKRPDSPDIAVAAITAAVEMAGRLAPKLPLYAGGKSFGGRMTTTAAARGLLGRVRGIVCFGFPLHPPKQAGMERAKHLEQVPMPILMIQGTRDDLADLKLVKQVVRANRATIRLHVVEAGDHSFAVLKSSGRTPADVLTEIAKAARAFIAR